MDYNDGFLVLNDNMNFSLDTAATNYRSNLFFKVLLKVFFFLIYIDPIILAACFVRLLVHNSGATLLLIGVVISPLSFK